MTIDHLVSHTFVVIDAAMDLATAKRAIEAAPGSAQASHVVISRQADGRDYWYLFAIDDVRGALRANGPDQIVEDVFGLHEWAATPTASPSAGPESIGDSAVIIDGGRPVGFVDRYFLARQPTAGSSGGFRGDIPKGHGAEPPAAEETAPPVRRGGGFRGLPPATPPAAPPTRGGGAAPAEAADLRSIEAEFPETVQVDAIEWLLVSIVNAAPTSTGLAITVAAGESIDILVQPRRGFTVVGEARATLAVPASGESLPLQFKLQAVDEGVGLIRVLAFHLGEPLGVIELEPTVTAATTSRIRGGTPSSPTKAAGATLSPPSPRVADLSMFIEEREVTGALEFVIRLTATDPTHGLNLRPYGPFRLEVDPAEFFESFFREIEELPLETPEQRQVADRKLAAKGSYLSETLLPPDLRETLWGLRDRIGSIIIQSEEPWIPWELCRLLGRDGDRVVEGPFLCEAFAVTRWLPGQGFKRPLHLTNLALIVPADSGLPLSGAERDYVLSLAAAGRTVTPITPTFSDVQNAFVAGVYDGLHFTGHGVAKDANPDKSAIILAANEEFSPEDVSGTAVNVGIPHPIVFINACQVGRGGMALTGIGGWARRFVQAGAGAFIGAYWSVYDDAAFEFSKQVYSRLIDGMPIGDAVKEARAAVRAGGDPTWLAYTVFADPLASVEPLSA
jgi:CHAT domain/Ternary complex associated domain 7